MPNLVGIGNSQVPTNAMLGGLAYKDSVGEIVIDKIKARASDTAVDIFVYDTSKDSDGGAWRKKATKQSWYDEGVSQRRGARKEFPAVAVIVVQSSYVTIYDGDDPNLPMWMEFTVNNSPGQIVFTNPTCAHMLNGLLVIGTNPNATNNDYWDGGIKLFNFISEDIRSYSGTRSMIYDMNISQRNDPKIITYDTTNVLVSPNVSAVTMFVLPNAPIDEYTGLPIPTIIAATRRGISVVRDTGVVYDMLVTIGGGSNYKTHSIEITKDLKILHNWSDRASDRFSFLSLIPLSLFKSDSSYGYEYQFRNEGTYQYNVGGGTLDIFNSVSTFFEDVVPTELGYFAIGSNKGLVNVQHIPMALNNGGRSGLGDARFSGGMHCRITNNFNTGWLYDNIKGAFLSDTSTTNITGSELVTNGDFASNNVTGWTERESGGSFTASGGQATLTYSSGVASWRQDITIVSGKAYTLSFQVVSTTTGSIQFYYNHGSGDLAVSMTGSAGKFSATFVAASNSVRIFPRIFASGNMVLDNISLRIAEEDRSVRNKGLQVFGTITKSAVETGADLVAYSNFSSGRYLFQPYNSDLDFTTTMSIMFWVKDWVGSDSLLHRGPGTTRNSKTSFHLYCSYDYNYRITFTTNGSTEQSFEFNHDANLSGWQCVCFTLSGGTVRGFRNGVEQTMSSTSFSGNIFSQATDKNGLWIGTGPVGGAADTASLALLRLSASAPSAEQVKKMYNDEKCLFHENAKCTLHGTSDHIKAIDYDESNNVTHVGTSAGRSEFRGLNRINNTTTAVTTAISVSNEFVAEQ